MKKQTANIAYMKKEHKIVKGINFEKGLYKTFWASLSIVKHTLIIIRLL